MYSRRTGVVLLACLVGIGFTLSGPMAGFGAEPEGLEVTLWLDKDTYVLGQPIIFVLTLRNASEHGLWARFDAVGLGNFVMEMAFEGEQYQKLHYRSIEHFATRPPMREFKPGEVRGVSEPIHFRRHRPSVGAATQDEIDLTPWLVCNRTGSYRLRASVYVDLADKLGDKGSWVVSNEVRFAVRPSAEGYVNFLRFSLEHAGDGFEISEKGYAAAAEIVGKLEGTPYQKYVRLAMMLHYVSERMDPEEPSPKLSDEEKEEREVYKGLAEQIVADPHQRQTRMGEIALVYLLAYELWAQHPQDALRYATILQNELPWSRNAGAVTIIRKQIEDELLSGERVEPRTDKTPSAPDAGP
ncbi:MAG: hypothetical protein WBD63_00800 [Phycisphaerae bacterium]|nr:hypothetical protein [Phycisphaerae bacterium]